MSTARIKMITNIAYVCAALFFAGTILCLILHQYIYALLLTSSFIGSLSISLLLKHVDIK